MSPLPPDLAEVAVMAHSDSHAPGRPTNWVASDPAIVEAFVGAVLDLVNHHAEHRKRNMVGVLR